MDAEKLTACHECCREFKKEQMVRIIKPGESEPSVYFCSEGCFIQSATQMVEVFKNMAGESA